jgi:hypothetical protein
MRIGFGKKIFAALFNRRDRLLRFEHAGYKAASDHILRCE